MKNIFSFITSQIGFNASSTSVEVTLKKRWDNVVSTLFQRYVVSTLHKVEKPTSGFVSFSSSDQCYIDVETMLIRRWNVGWDSQIKQRSIFDIIVWHLICTKKTLFYMKWRTFFTKKGIWWYDSFTSSLRVLGYC